MTDEHVSLTRSLVDEIIAVVADHVTYAQAAPLLHSLGNELAPQLQPEMKSDDVSIYVP